ncbi:hypothetical protein GQ55_9G170000 [Panicum hallii var. hallii]|uniref:FRIGIDA-like protein n=1 Tax=Panicum hallii var. hallii TaxID=1504633 RepID=A0A2T7C430_9POAL|nr:hypothetical protein GQ55_9G170000 [Panicum hallii var. hallii]
MDTATAQCPAAPKPQNPPPSMPPSPAMMTVAELEAAVAALPGKRDALREAFDRLAACSPSPLPFAWEDIDAHLSSLHWSISLRFRQVRALEAARPAPAAAAPGGTNGDGTGESLEGEEVLEVEEEVVEEDEEVVEVEEVVEEEEEVLEAEERVVEQEEEEMANEEMQEGDSGEADDMIGKDGKDEKEGRDEVMEEEEVVEAADDKIGNEIKDDKDAREEMQVANEEEQSTEDGKKASRDGEDANMKEEQSTKNAKKASQNKEEEQSMEDAKKASLDKEEDGDMDEAATNKASAVQGKEQEACNEKQVEEEDEQEAHKEEQDAKNTTKEEKAKKVSQDQGSGARPGPIEFSDLAAAVTSMDAQRLVMLIHTNVGLSSKFRAAMSHAPDGAALSLRIVELFLHDKTFKTNKVWNNCVGLIRTVPEVVTKLSTESIEHAKQLAKDWKEMIDNPGSWMALGSLSSWGLLNFLISYNIVSEFDTKEIFRIFGTIPHKQQRKNHFVLLKGLGLADRIPELMDYLIGNGQQMNALYLAPFFNLVDKYPPLCLLKGYVEKAKQTVMEISQKSMTRQSLRKVIIKELDNLRMARDLAKQRITDSGLRTGIMAEIHVLLGEFGKKKRSLADASTALTSNPQQQKTESSKKRKKEQVQDHHKGQENQQERQQSKPGEKLEKKQKKSQQEQQQKEQNKPQKEQQQKQEDKLQEKQQKWPRRRTPKLPALASPAAQTALLRGHSGHPPYAAMHRVHHAYPAQPGWPAVHCAPPFAPQLGAPEYIGPFDPIYHRPEFHPW